MKGFKKVVSVMLILAVCFVTLPAMATEAETKTSATTESTMTSQPETTTSGTDTEQVTVISREPGKAHWYETIRGMVTIGIVCIGVGIAVSQSQ